MRKEQSHIRLASQQSAMERAQFCYLRICSFVISFPILLPALLLTHTRHTPCRPSFNMPFYSSLYKHLITLKIGLQRPDDDQAAFRKFYQQFKSIWSSTFSGEHNQDDGRNEFLFLFDVMDIYIDRQSDCEYLRPKAIQEVERLIVQQESFTP